MERESDREREHERELVGEKEREGGREQARLDLSPDTSHDPDRAVTPARVGMEGEEERRREKEKESAGGSRSGSAANPSLTCQSWGLGSPSERRRHLAESETCPLIKPSLRSSHAFFAELVYKCVVDFSKYGN